MAKIETLIDAFSGGSISALWTVSAPSGSVTVDGRCNLEVNAPYPNTTFVTSVSTYDLLDSSTKVEIISIPPASEGAITNLIQLYQPSSGKAIYWGTQVVSGVTKIQGAYQGGGYVTVYTADYNASTHRWVRIRNTGGRTYWEYSADNISWSVADSRSSATIPTTALKQTFYVLSGGSTSEMVVDNVNFDPTRATIAGSSDITATAYNINYLSETFAGSSTFTADPSIDVTINEIDRKTYLYKVYGTDGSVLGTWPDVVSDFTYSQEINSAGSAVDVELARNSDTLFVTLDNLITQAGDQVITEDSRSIVIATESANAIGPGSNVDHNLNVDIYVFYGRTANLVTEAEDQIITEAGDSLIVDVGAVNGRRIFSGYISKITSRYGGQESTLVSLFSFGAELDQYVIESGVDTTVTYNSQDPSADILTDIIDKYEAAGGVVSYSSSSIEATGSTVSYTFNTNTTLEGIKKCLELSPSDWVFFLDMGENLIYFFSRPTTPSHTFVLGKHIVGLNLESYIEDLVNVVYFSGGDTGGGSNLFKKYTDTDSITAYRRGLERVSDNRVTLSSSADVISESIIERGKEPRYRSNITISDKVYDIESIRLGDLIGFRNFGNYVDALTMQVVRIDYTPDAVSLQLDTLLPSVPKRVEDIRRNLEAVDTLENPTAPS